MVFYDRFEKCITNEDLPLFCIFLKFSKFDMDFEHSSACLNSSKLCFPFLLLYFNRVTVEKTSVKLFFFTCIHGILKSEPLE